MDVSKHQDDLLYKYEILRARLEIRDHYLDAVVKEIYENTAQVLSLVRVQLATVCSKAADGVKDTITESGLLIGQAIYDLREMGKSFFPENEILSESGLVKALKRELGISKEDGAIQQIKVQGIPFDLSAGDGIVFFVIVLEILTQIIHTHGSASVELQVIYSNTKLNLIISYSGTIIDFRNIHNDSRVSVESKPGITDRIKLIGGELNFNKNTGDRPSVDVSIPYNNSKVA